MTTAPHEDLPAVTAGLIHLDVDEPRSGAIHRLALASTADASGPTYWIDAAGIATTYAFFEHGRRLDGLHVARAFTAYQHHTLVHDLAARVDGRTALVVVPALDALYADEDVPEAQAPALLADVLDALERLVARHGTPVLVSAGTAAFADRVAERADRRIVARETALGTAFEGESFRTTVYRGAGFWQTTIPYWVDLLGALEAAEPALAPAHPTLPAPG